MTLTLELYRVHLPMLLDSSISLLFSLLLAQLPVFTSALPANRRQMPDLDKLTNQTKNLMKITKDLLKDNVFQPDIELHRFKNLPAMNNRASDLSNLELKPTLTQLHTDLKTFEHHFEWLTRVSKKHHHPVLPKLVDMIREMKSVIAMLHRQMQKVEAQRVPHATPSLPPHIPVHWDVLQSSQELLQQFTLYCDWAIRALMNLKPKIAAAQ
ncbi:interleukin-11 [Aplochiton taeniatus]